MRSSYAWLIWTAVAVAGCGDRELVADGELLDGCYAETDTGCAPDLECISRSCTKACEVDSDCIRHPDAPPTSETAVCGIGADGDRLCLRDACTFGTAWGVVCEGDTSIACGAHSEVSCRECGGCPGGTYCAPGGGCVPLEPVGGPCAIDDQCRSANCSEWAGVCRQPVGSPCAADGSDCDRCLLYPSGSFCSRRCWASDRCNGHRCEGRCVRDCSSSSTVCPGLCEYDACVCEPPDCEWAEVLRPVGASCRFPTDCESSFCYTTAAGEAYCSRPCARSADCGGDTVCAVATCPEDAPSEHCGLLCMKLCEEGDGCGDGACVSASVVEGGSRLVCNMDPADGPPPSRQSNGEPCSSPDQCLSNFCDGGQCRGNALLGEPCTTSFDCAVGACVDGECT